MLIEYFNTSKESYKSDESSLKRCMDKYLRIFTLSRIAGITKTKYLAAITYFIILICLADLSTLNFNCGNFTKSPKMFPKFEKYIC